MLDNFYFSTVTYYYCIQTPNSLPNLVHGSIIVSISLWITDLRANLFWGRKWLHFVPLSAPLKYGNTCLHYNGLIISAMASQITSLAIVYSTVYSGVDERKHQYSASLAFGRGIHRWPVNSLHNGPVKRKMFLFDDVIIFTLHDQYPILWLLLTKAHCYFCDLTL